MHTCDEDKIRERERERAKEKERGENGFMRGKKGKREGEKERKK